MGKRAPHDADGAAAFRKRQKITHEIPTGEDVVDSAHLRTLLSFDQDVRKARHGLQSFKRLLDAIRSDNENRQANLSILNEYLEDVKPRTADDDSVYLSDIMEMWSFAAQVHNDEVASSVAVVLALLLHIISNSLDLLPHGLGICRTLLQDQQLKSFTKNLSAPKNAGFIISPTLRLLTEAVCLDGGAFAKRIFRARDSTFVSLGRNLELGHVGEGQEDVHRASIRTNAVRFLLSCVRYLHSAARKELLSQREWISHLTYTIKNDPPYLALEILDSLKRYILMDEKIDRPSKLRAFNTKTLMRVLALYGNSSTAVGDETQVTVGDKAHEFLLYIGTTQGAGILYPATGLYPKTAEEDSPSLTRGATATNSSDLWAGALDDGIPVYNFVLSEVAQKLRPWSNSKHAELLVAIFTAAPELISDYFYNNRSFTFEPKLTMTWIGYAAFLFNTMMIPIPPSFGDRVLYAAVPPPVAILLDNIIPLPISQKVLSKCFNPDSHLTSFFATRILVVALEKLTSTLALLEGGFRSTSPIWKDTARQLIDAFCRRIPDMVELVRSYKALPSEHYLHRTVASRLLRLYYEAVPRVALAANFDVSPFLAEMLKKIDDNADPEASSFGMIELEHLVSIASYSPGMRWFVRPGKPTDGKTLSPFTALLRLLCQSDSADSSMHLKKVLEIVAVESQVVSQSAKLNDIYRALQALRSTSKDDLNPVWQYLDNSITRCASSPIKYVELFESKIAEAASVKEKQTFSLLGIALAEQLSFAVATATKSDRSLLGRFLSLYLNAANLPEGKKPVLCAVHQQIRDALKEASVKIPKLGASEDVDLLRAMPVDETDSEDNFTSIDRQPATLVDATMLRETLHVEQHPVEDNAVLVRWASQSVEDLLEDDWAARLVHLLLSPHTHIRKEALTNLLKLAAKVKESSYEEKDQIWLILSELVESSTSLVTAGPVPSPFVAFTTHAIDVLRNPLHVLYPKVNTFLTRGPVWSPDRLPLAPDILHGEPSEDDRYYTELAWLLTYFLDALRTPADLAVFHRRRWFEKILALAGNPYVRSNLRQKILRIVYRATEIEDGSTTLATRFGVFSWLATQKAVCDVEEEIGVYDALIRRVWETCDQKRVGTWSQGGVEKLVEQLHKA